MSTPTPDELRQQLWERFCAYLDTHQDDNAQSIAGGFGIPLNAVQVGMVHWAFGEKEPPEGWM